jgi:hypothetical protein
MTIQNEKMRQETLALIRAAYLMPNYLDDALVQRRVGRLIAKYASIQGYAKIWRARELQFERLLQRS